MDNSIIMDGTPRPEPRRHHCYSESINMVLLILSHDLPFSHLMPKIWNSGAIIFCVVTRCGVGQSITDTFTRLPIFLLLPAAAQLFGGRQCFSSRKCTLTSIHKWLFDLIVTYCTVKQEMYFNTVAVEIYFSVQLYSLKRRSPNK